MNQLRTYNAQLKDRIQQQRNQLNTLSNFQSKRLISSPRRFDTSYEFEQMRRMEQAHQRQLERTRQQHQFLKQMKERVKSATDQRVKEKQDIYYCFKKENEIFQQQKKDNQQQISQYLNSKLSQLKIERDQFKTQQQNREKQRIADIRNRRIAEAREQARMREETARLENLYQELNRAKRAMM